MRANMKVFGNMDNKSANGELRQNLTEIKRAAESLLHLMDLSSGRICFDSGELEKFLALRQAILDFRSVEIAPEIPLEDRCPEQL